MPPWVYDLIAAVEEYEDCHADHRAGWPCLGEALGKVPENEKDRAAAIVSYNRQRKSTEGS